jgi:transcriptional regulator with XRE-family HTH domain
MHRRRRPRSALRRERLLAELSITELARLAGRSRTTIHLLETGQSSPTLGTIKRIAKVLAQPIDVLFPDEDFDEDERAALRGRA